MLNDQHSSYAGYVAWKSWTEADDSHDHAAGYRIEMARAQIKSGDRILEIGFGKGTFLDWAKDNSYEVEGVELIPELVEAARARGHRVHLNDGDSIFSTLNGSFSLIVLFDVLEHLSISEIGEFFSTIEKYLAKDGKLLARFPNGGSPFGRLYQYGDLTHKSVLTASSLDQLARHYGMHVVGHYNAARYSPARKGIKSSRVAQFIVFFFRDIVQILIGIAYFGKNVPLDPNIFVIIMKRDEKKNIDLIGNV